MWPTLGSRTAKEQNSPSIIWGGTHRVVSVYVHASGLLLACLRLLIVLLIEYIGIFLSSFFYGNPYRDFCPTPRPGGHCGVVQLPRL